MKTTKPLFVPVEPQHIDPMLKIADVQQICNISRAAAYNLLASGLSYVRIGRSIRIRQSVLERFLAEREQQHV